MSTTSRAIVVSRALSALVDSGTLASAPKRLRIEVEEMVTSLGILHHVADQEQLVTAAEVILERARAWLGAGGQSSS